MNLYIIIFHNPTAQETQVFQVFAKNGFRAARKFHRHYKRRLKDSIEQIIKVESTQSPKPKLLELLVVYYGYESTNLEELFQDIVEDYGEPVPDHLQRALRYLILRTEGEQP